MSEIIPFLLAGGAIGFMLALTQWLSNRYKEQTFYWRKALHITAIGICGLMVDQTEQEGLLTIIFGVAALGLGWVVHKRWLGVSSGRSWGIALFPLAFMILLLLPFGKREVVTAIYVLTFSDAFAGLIGNRWGKPWTPWKEQKSILGSSVFALTALLILWVRHGQELEIGVLIAIAIALAGLEMFSWRGSDNLWIPLGTALFLTTIPRLETDSFALMGLVGVYGLFAMIIRSRKWLDPTGIAAAGMLALWIALLFPLSYLGVPLFFLALGSVSSKITSGAENDQEENGRTAVQVLANGSWVFLAGACSVMGAPDLGISLFLLVFSIALSDTLSSEWGRYFGGSTYDIVKGKRVAPGLSGGVSVVGTMVGLLGAVIIPVVSVWFWGLDIQEAIAISCMAFVGMLVDSVLGSLLQSKYKGEDGQWQDGYHQDKTVLGFHWINNHTVNFLSIGLTLIGYLVFQLWV